MYVLVNTYMVALALSRYIYEMLLHIVNTHEVPTYTQMHVLGSFCLNCLLSVTLSFFFKFHLNLALSNSTTIETMDKKVTNKSTFNKGLRKNWEQIFGKNPWLWMLPFTGESGKPIGDGVVWSLPILIDIEEIPDEDNERKEPNTKELKYTKEDDEEAKGKDIATAPDSIGNRSEKTRAFYHPEVKNTSGRIEINMNEDLILSPEP